ncbi:MAG: tetratricopeptide repeat protein [Planctomycetota bacterium]|nr:tetratricopeptide repeat protein [Planctomycetota bacterium]
MGKDSTTVADRRRSDPSALTRLVKGDLDWITMRALEKDRTRRYASASEMAADIERHLSNQPVLASPPGLLYVARKFVRRHRVAALAGLAVTLAVVGGLVVSSVLYLQAVEAKEEAQKQANRSDAVVEYVRKYLGTVDARSEGHDVRVVEVLDRLGKSLDEVPPSDPEIEAELRGIVGWNYRGLSLYKKAEPYLRSDLKIRREVTGVRHPKTVKSMARLAMLLTNLGDVEEAERLYREAVGLQREVLGDIHSYTLETINHFAKLMKNRDKLDEAEALAQEALRGRKLAGNNELAVLASMDTLASIRTKKWLLIEAEDLYRRVLKNRLRLQNTENQDVLKTKSQLAYVLILMDRGGEAEMILPDLLAIHRRVMGEDHMKTLSIMSYQGQALHLQKRWEEAEKIFRHVLRARLDGLRSTHRSVLASKSHVAASLKSADDADEAEKLFREVLAIDRARPVSPR